MQIIISSKHLLGFKHLYFYKNIKNCKKFAVKCYFSKKIGNIYHVHKPFSFSLFSPTHTNLLPNRAV